MDKNVYLSPKRAADFIDHSPQTLANWRWRGTGPKYRKVGRAIRYRIEDLIDFMESQTVVLPRKDYNN